MYMIKSSVSECIYLPVWIVWQEAVVRQAFWAGMVEGAWVVEGVIYM